MLKSKKKIIRGKREKKVVNRKIYTRAKLAFVETQENLTDRR